MSLGGGGSKTPPPTAEEKALAERGALEWNDYVERYVPLENKLIQLSTPDASTAERLRGEANAVAAKGLQDAYQAQVTQGLKRGLSSAAIGSGLAAVADTRASATGAGMAKAEGAVKDRELKAKTKLAAYGRGLADQSTLGLSRAAQAETRKLVEEFNAKQQEKLAVQQALGAAIGLAGSSFLKKYQQNKAAAAEQVDAGHKAWVDSGFGYADPYGDFVGP